MSELTVRQRLAFWEKAYLRAASKAGAPPGFLEHRLPASPGICRFAKMFTDVGALLLSLVLAGCVSSQMPSEIRQVPVKPISVPQVQRKPASFLDRRVRWGGAIIGVRNRKRATEIEVLSRPLSSRGEPLEKEPGEGRFIALLAGFADPAEFPKDRLLTVTGRLKGVQTRSVGEYPYPYPVVAVKQRYLWPKPEPNEPPYYYRDPWYDSWYGPWYPWGWPRFPWGWGPYY